MDLALDCGPFLPSQWEGFAFDPPPGQIGITAFLGGWGSGKTHGAARKFLRRVLENPWHEGYKHGVNPTSIIVAPTHKVLTQATLQQFRSICPRDLIIYDRGMPHHDMMLINGHRILKHSGESEIEGMDATCVWIDEIHRPQFALNPTKYLNLLARLRDSKARCKEMIVSGLPESGWVRDTFDVDSPNRKTVLMNTQSNRHIDKNLIGVFYQNCPSGLDKMLLGGQWMPPEGCIYSQYDSTIHVTDRAIDRRTPVHIGLDIGNHGAALVAQEIQVQIKDIVGRISRAKGLYIVDQVLTHNESVEDLCYRLKMKTEWIIQPGVSTVCTDPTTRRDELQVLRRHFPGCRIIKREHGHELFPVESGIRITQRALCDALGNVRLYFARTLVGEKTGILDSIAKYRRNEKISTVIKDDRTDHVCDSLRYLVCEHLQAEKPQTVVL